MTDTSNLKHIRGKLPHDIAQDMIESLATSIFDAAYAYHTGYPVAADAILELAEAAERVLMRRGNASVNTEQQQ